MRFACARGVWPPVISPADRRGGGGGAEWHSVAGAAVMAGYMINPLLGSDAETLPRT
jgi:hypothetical protein